MVFFKRIFLGLSLTVVLISCAVNPVTGEKEFSLVSAEQEVAIGVKNYQPSRQSQGGRYYLDPELQLYVADIGRKLAAVSDRPGLPYEFMVLNNSTPNAWALPGGKIAINRGLLMHLNSEAELAAVLAHEIVHAAARHSAAQMTRGSLIGLGAQAVAIAGNNYGVGQLAGTAAQVGAAAWMARYGRGAELESDAYGMEYMSRAGYNPQGAVDLQRTFVKLSEGRQQDFISGLFASHPPSQSRVNANIEKAKILPGGADYRQRYQSKIAQLKRDEPAYQAQKEAMKALKDKDGKTALAHLDKAIKIQPRDSYSWELRGHAWEMLENTSNAEKAFGTSINKNPDYFGAYLSRGIIRFKNNQRSQAKSDLLKSYQLLPSQPAGFYLGKIALQENDSAATQYFRVAANGRNEMAKSAQTELAKLELATSPGKYIRSAVSVSTDGYLQVTLQNSSPLAVENTRIQISEMVNSFIAGNSQTIKGPNYLAAGKKVTLKTRIGGLQKEDIRKYRSKVVAAVPVID